MTRKSLTFAILLVLLMFGFTKAQSSHKNPREFINRGNASYAKAEYIAAIEEYAKVPPQAGKVYSQALYNIGVCYYELWRTEDAIAMYRKAIAAQAGRYSMAFYALGVALEDQKRQDEAREAYRQAIVGTARREAAPAHFMLGLLLLRERDYETAANHFTEAITRETSPASHNNLGVALARMGRLHEAEREFELALSQADGAFADATTNLKLCRSLLRASPTGHLASLRVVTATKEFDKNSSFR